MTNDDLLALGSSRWALPMLAFLHAARGAKFVTLAKHFDMSRDSLSRTLQHLADHGWISRNPGHGHPLRPEYILTALGERLAEQCARIMSVRDRLGLEPEQLSRWSLPVIAATGTDWIRFSTLQTELLPVTARALSLTLKQLMGSDLLTRRLEDDFPPVPLYGLTRRGERLAAALT
jgi:DNA-binding HxlR family transcriptional regulator